MSDQTTRPVVPLENPDSRSHRRQLAERVNAAFPKDGTERMTAPLKLKSYVIADLPDATLWEGALVFVSDGSAGQKLRYSDGTNWIVAG
jgi:hypothetical protein